MPHRMGQTLHYKHSRFVTRLPVDYLYSPSHSWVARSGADEGRWRVGLTRFATRMLGEMVDHGFEAEPGAAVELGQVLGWVEGFKAISDMFGIVAGRFEGSNPVLREKIELISKKPYDEGWLYEATGSPDANCVDVHEYVRILDKTIERILEQSKGEEIQ